MNITTVLRRAATITITATVCTGLLAQPSQALVTGELHATAKIQKYNSSINKDLGEFGALFSPVQDSHGNFRSVTFGPDGNHLVTIAQDGSLLKKTLLANFNPVVYQMFIDTSDNMYFAVSQQEEEGGSYKQHILRYNSSDSISLDIVLPNSTYPTSIALEANGNIIVPTAGGEGAPDGIRIYNRDGGLVKTSPIPHNGSTTYLPANIALNKEGNLFATLLDRESTDGSMFLAEIDTDGNILRTLDNGATYSGSYGIAVDQDDNIYASSMISDSDGPDQCANLLLVIRKYDHTGTYIGNIDTSPESSEGAVCPTYNAGVASSLAATSPLNITKRGDIFIGSGAYTGALGKARIVKYSYVNTQATFAQNSHTAQAKLNLPDTVELLEATTSTVNDMDAPSDPGNQYPLGLVYFKAKVTDILQPVPVELFFVTDLKPTQVKARKYHSSTKQYGDIPGSTITQTELDGKPALKLSYTITDNGELDEDMTPGVIVDPVGLATAADTDNSGAIGAPNTGSARQAHVPSMLLIGAIAVMTSVAAARLTLHRKVLVRQRNIQRKRR